MYFSKKDIKHLAESYSKIESQYNKLAWDFTLACSNLKKERSKEFASHGFLRRITTLKRCIENIYEICPPDNEGLPTSEERSDLAINIHSFVINIYGCIDNLAWIWVFEKEYKYKKNTEISFFNKNIQKLLSKDFRLYLKGLDKWIEHIENFRHSLAHRIPLYVVPRVLNPEELKKSTVLENQKAIAMKKFDFELYDKLNEEQNKLGKFAPWITHSFEEKSPQAVFHRQILADWSTIIEISEKFLKELGISSKNQ